MPVNNDGHFFLIKSKKNFLANSIKINDSVQFYPYIRIINNIEKPNFELSNKK
jgi:hypothetical protein